MISVYSISLLSVKVYESNGGVVAEIVVLAFRLGSCYNCFVAKCAYSSADRAPASGAGSAGSSPARRAISISNPDQSLQEPCDEGFGFYVREHCSPRDVYQVVAFFTVFW